MIIVLEGPDGSGKTMLAARLKNERGFEIRHEGPPPADVSVFHYYLNRLFDAAMLAVVSKGVVLDRFAYGELVYGPELRGGSRLSVDEWRTIRKSLEALGAIQVVCLPGIRTARDSWLERKSRGGELVLDVARFDRIYRHWERFANRATEKQRIWNWRADAASRHGSSLGVELFGARMEGR